MRRDSEWADSHLDGAVHIPLHELAGRLGELPDGEIWVHCQSGYRAAIAASMLAARGRDVVAVYDSFTAAPAARPGGPGRADSSRPARGCMRGHGNAAGWPRIIPSRT